MKGEWSNDGGKDGVSMVRMMMMMMMMDNDDDDDDNNDNRHIHTYLPVGTVKVCKMRSKLTCTFIKLFSLKTKPLQEKRAMHEKVRSRRRMMEERRDCAGDDEEEDSNDDGGIFGQCP